MEKPHFIYKRGKRGKITAGSSEVGRWFSGLGSADSV
jgi:hypothetical protein